MRESRPRTRLTPEARHDQLLDSAQVMVTADGLQAFTMEGLAKAASVSAPLVYNYFPNRMELLHQLLKREFQRFINEISIASDEANNIEDIVRMSVTSNLDHQAPGTILPLLLSQPEIAVAISEQRQRARRQSARFLVRAAAKQYQLNDHQAQLAVSMSSGASIAAAEFAASVGLKREDAIELAVSYILAGIERISQIDLSLG